MGTTGPVNILGIPGSLRQASYNKAALKAAQELLPSGATLEVFGLDGIPPFNEDDQRALPPRVVELKARVREADAILIATPEYNYSVPGVLKAMAPSRSDLVSALSARVKLECAGGGLRRASRAISRFYGTAFAPLDLTATQFSLLVAVNRL